MDLSGISEKAPASWGSATWPLGSNWTPNETTFAVLAPDATRVQLEFYIFGLDCEASVTVLPKKGTEGIWRAKLTGVPVGALYGYRVWGPNWPYVKGWEPGSAIGFVTDFDKKGNRFNPNKVLFDPYTREVTHTTWTDALDTYGVDGGVFGTGADDYQGKHRREVDTARYAPKGVVLDEQPRQRTTKPRNPGESAIIYEVQIHQLCGHPSVAKLSEILAGETGFEDVVDIPPRYQGTYRGAAMMAPYLKGLGFNTIELLPIQETNKSESARQGKTNSWGYMTMAFFSPTRQYAYDQELGGPTREFQDMVDAFHDAGLEVYLDVVYNHTGEGGNWNGDVNTTGFTSLGGFGTAQYYSMTNSFILIDGATGTSNQLNYSSEAARDLVMDSLRYWTEQMGVDGFRFDLATVLGRLPDAADPEDWNQQKRFFTDHPLLVEIADFAASAQIEVIAEAWDLWGYEVGNFPRGWGEWNGRYRDAVRRFAKGDGNTVDFIDMFNGDYHHFSDSGGAQKSINFIDAHDGFNMADLVSYQNKVNNQPYPFGPSDGGSDNNLSWDSGGSHPLRRQRIRNFWALLFLSRGVPMVVAGDEFGRTQNGNNNPWALESVAMRNNYNMISSNCPQRVPVAPGVKAAYHNNLGTFGTEPGVNGLFRFCQFIANLRRNHAALQQRSWGDEVPDNGDVSYLFHSPTDQGYPYEGDRALAVNINSDQENFWVMINMSDQSVTFDVAQPDAGKCWRTLIDTATRAESHSNFWPSDTGPIAEEVCEVESWSVVVFQECETTASK